MVSGPTTTEKTNNSEAKTRIWLVCPICKKANPAGTLYCQFCWGPSLYSVKPVTSIELEEIIQRQETRQKRLSVLRTMAVAIIAPLLLFSVVFFWLYNFTDIIFAPTPQINSSSLPGQMAMFRHDLMRTGSSDITSISPQGNIKWTFQTAADIHSSPVVVNDTVYFGSRDHKFYAIDAATGQKRWEFLTGSWVESSPAVVNGVVYFGSNDGKFYALDAATGAKLWDFKTFYAVKSSPAVADGIVYFGSDDYSVYAVDAKTGARIWRFETKNYISSSPVVSNGIVYVGSMDYACYALNAQSGRFRLRLATYQVTSSPAVKNGVVYFTSRNYLFAMDGKARNWPREADLRPWWLELYVFHLAPPPPPRSGFLWALKLDSNASNTTPVIADDNAMYTTGGNKVYRLDLTTQKFQWTFTAGGNINSSPALSNNVVYVGCDDGKLYAIDANTGKQLWNVATSAKITSSPSYSNGVVYVTSEDGNLYAIQ